MNNFINKNILIDDLLEYNITFNNEVLYSIQELKDSIDIKYDNILLNNIKFHLEIMINESTDYLYSISHNEFESITIKNYINDLLNAQHKINDYLLTLNNTEILSDLMNDIKL